MATITLKGDPIHTSGNLPRLGAKAPPFTLTGGDLQDIELGDYAGRRVLLNIVPSLDTPVCGISTRKFNEHARRHSGDVVAVVSADLPFAQVRFCGNEGLENVVTLSTFRSRFPEDYGVRISDGPLAGVTARAVVVIDAGGIVRYTQLVPEIGEEPDYREAIKALEGC